MNSIEKRIRKLEEQLNVSKVPGYREFINDYEDKYHDVDLGEILAREKIKFDICVIHDLVNRDEKIELYKRTGEIKEF